MDESAPDESKAARRTLLSRSGEAPPSTQFIVLVWCLWLVSAWGLATLLDSQVPAARWLVLMAMVGLMLIWPAARLSGGQHRVPMTAIAVEWLCLALVFQAVIWPLQLISGWRLDQTAWLNAAVLAWSLLTAAVVATGVQFPRPLPRAVAMVLCVLLVVGEPIALALAVTTGGKAMGWEMRLTPLPTLWALAHPVANVSLAPWPGRILTTAGAAVAAWGAAGLTMTLGRRRPRG